MDNNDRLRFYKKRLDRYIHSYERRFDVSGISRNEAIAIEYARRTMDSKEFYYHFMPSLRGGILPDSFFSEAMGKLGAWIK